MGRGLLIGRDPELPPRARRALDILATTDIWIDSGLEITSAGKLRTLSSTVTAATHPLYITGHTVRVDQNDDGNIFMACTENTTTTGARNLVIHCVPPSDTSEPMQSNTTGSVNLVVNLGDSMLENTTGDNNIVMGQRAMRDNETGDENIVFGQDVLTEAVAPLQNIVFGTDIMDNEPLVAIDNVVQGSGILASADSVTEVIAFGTTIGSEFQQFLRCVLMGTQVAVTGGSNPNTATLLQHSYCIGYRAGRDGLYDYNVLLGTGSKALETNLCTIGGIGATEGLAVGFGRNTAPADASVSTSQVYLWFDNTNGAAVPRFKGKQANGTVVNGRMVHDADFGDITVTVSGSVWTIDNNAVTYAKMQDVSAAQKLLGRGDSGSGDPQEITLGTGLSMSGTTLNATGGGGSGAAAFEGALIYLSSNTAGFTSETAIPWTAVSYDTEHDPADGGATQRFWLGANFTFATTDVDTANDDITETGHGFTTGEGPVWFSSSTTLPGGLSASTNYWIIVLDADTFQVATSRANALAGTFIDLTSTGTGTHTCVKATRLVVPKGVTKVRLSGGMRTSSSDTDVQYLLRIFKNGAAFIGGGNQEVDTAGTDSLGVSSAVVSVSEGDYFELIEFGGSANTLLADQTWFAIQVLESTSASGRSRVSVQFDKTTNTTLGNITGLTANVFGGRTYHFRAWLDIDADATGGIKLAIGGTATATAIRYTITAYDLGGPGSLRITSRETALGGDATAAGQTSYTATIEGTITVNAAGTLTAQFAQSVSNGTSSVLVGSTFDVVEFA